jgi:hypothetical protein
MALPFAFAAVRLWEKTPINSDLPYFKHCHSETNVILPFERGALINENARDWFV